jgi:cell division protein FtsL
VAWIVVVAALLAGIVALNVAVLRLNMDVERLDGQRSELMTGNDTLASELSAAAAAGRIERLARGHLGLVAPTQTTYLELRSGRRAR